MSNNPLSVGRKKAWYTL